MRSTMAPHRARSPVWSTWKFDHRVPAGVSAVRRIAGVRAFAASTRPVSELVNPGPWCVVQTATRPLARPYPSAMLMALFSWRAVCTSIPASRRALARRKLPLPSTPNEVRTPPW